MNNRSVTALAKSFQLIPETSSRIPISVRFTLRSPKKGYSYDNPHALQVWIMVDGKRIRFGAKWPLNDSSGRILVDPAKWNVARQCTSNRVDPANEAIIALKAHIVAVYRKQKQLATPTINSVHFQLLTDKTPDFIEGEGWITDIDQEKVARTISAESHLSRAYAAHINKLRAKIGKSPKRSDQVAIGRWERGLFFASGVGAAANQANPRLPACYIGLVERLS